MCVHFVLSFVFFLLEKQHFICLAYWQGKIPGLHCSKGVSFMMGARHARAECSKMWDLHLIFSPLPLWHQRVLRFVACIDVGAEYVSEALRFTGTLCNP